MRSIFSKFALVAAIGFALTFTFSCSSDDGGNNNGGSSSPSGNGGSSSSGNSGGSGPVKKDKISGFSQKGPFVRGSAITLYELGEDFVQTGRSFNARITDDKGSFEIKNIELVSSYAILEADGHYRNEVTGNISAAPIKLYAIADIREKSNVNVNILTHLEYYRVLKLVEEGKSLKDAKQQAQREILAVFGISGEFGNSEDMSIFGTTDGDAALLAISILLQGELSEGQFVERLADFSFGFEESGAWDNEAAKNAIADWAKNETVEWDADYCLYEEPSECLPMPTDDMCYFGILVKNCSDPGSTSGITNLTKIRSNILGWSLSSAIPDFEKFVENYWYANYGLGACNVDLQGSIKNSNRGITYVCKNGNWQTPPKYIDIKCFESKSCSTFTDPRDNQSYFYVKIDDQIWMAENLNYNVVRGSRCYNDSLDNCNKYGRLYYWDTAMELPSSCSSDIVNCSDQVGIKHKGICPEGWHIPSKGEWEILGTNATKLKSTSGWNSGNGTDNYGFSALPGGNRPYGNTFIEGGSSGVWWSASESIADGGAYSLRITKNNTTFIASGVPISDKRNMFSVRCIKD